MRFSIAAWLSPFCLLAASALADPQAQVTFHFENAKLQPAKYTIEVNEEGAGRFHADPGQANPDDPAALPPLGQERPIQISSAVTRRIFSIARQKHDFAFACESGGDAIAFQGKKTLAYNGPGGSGSCTYNYSKDAQIQWLTQEFESIASTLEEGRKLQLEYDHGKLSLDAELETLEEMVRNGQAAELENIAPLLHTIASDDSVMQRAQRRARALLTQATNSDK